MRTFKLSISLLLLAIITIVITGCGEPKHIESPPVSINPAVTGNIRSKILQNTKAFMLTLQVKDFKKAREYFSTNLQKQMPERTLSDALNSNLRPYLGSTKWQTTSLTSASHGRNYILRSTFTGADNNHYGTNIIYIQEGNKLLIEKLIPPAKYTAPNIREQNTAKSKGS